MTSPTSGRRPPPPRAARIAADVARFSQALELGRTGGGAASWRHASGRKSFGVTFPPVALSMMSMVAQSGRFFPRRKRLTVATESPALSAKIEAVEFVSVRY
jgi:hypothetical protein